MNERGYDYWKKFLLVMVLTMLCWLPVRAQQEPPAAPDEPTLPKQVDSTVPVLAGRSSPLVSYNSFLRWGPIYIRTMEFLEGYDQIDAAETVSQTGIFNQRNFTSSVFRTDIIYDRQLKQSRLEFQYSPHVNIVNGNVSSNFVNQNVNLNWIQQLSPRWTLGLSPSLTYMQVRQLYGEYFLDANTITATTTPSSFLDGPGSWLNTNMEATVTCALSPVSTVSVIPSFGYSHVGGEINATQRLFIYQYGGKIRWDKRFSATRGMNASYYSRVVGDLGNGTIYQNGEIGYNQQFGPSTLVETSVGLLTEGFAHRNWNVSGFAQLSRKLGRSTGAVAYFRGFPLFSETASQGVAQRVEASYRLELSQRWYSQVQGGYENSLSTTALHFSGKYIAAQLGYNLTPGWSSFVSYAHKTQSGTDARLLVGTRDFYSVGIRWSARPVQ